MMLLTRPEQPVEAVIVGASGGIGLAMLETLLQNPAVERVHAFARRQTTRLSQLASSHNSRLSLYPIDLAEEASIEAAMAKLGPASPNLVLITSGLLYTETRMPEKSWRQLDGEYFHQQMQINALAPALLAKHLIPRMPKDQPAIFAALSARVGSIGDNRLGGWYSYRASKAALNMLLKCTAIEAKRRWPQLVVTGLHPGTVDTALSAPFQSRVPEGKLFTPEHCATSLLKVLDGLTPQDSGQVFAWDGQPIVP